MAEHREHYLTMTSTLTTYASTNKDFECLKMYIQHRNLKQILSIKFNYSLSKVIACL